MGEQMSELRNFGEACLLVCLAFALLSYFLPRMNRVVLRRTPPPMFILNLDPEISKSWAKICGAISFGALFLGLLLLLRS